MKTSHFQNTNARRLESKDVRAIETLEARIAPAGVLQVTFSGGILSVAGDDDANAAEFATAGSNKINIIGKAGTLISVNGANPTAAVQIEGLVQRFDANLGGGGDILELKGLTVAKDMSLQAGVGPDVITIDDLRVGGKLSIDTGAETDLVQFGGKLVSAGQLDMKLGDGGNTVRWTGTLERFEVAGATRIVCGSGGDSVISEAVAMDFGGSVLIDAGTGTNTIDISPLSLIGRGAWKLVQGGLLNSGTSFTQLGVDQGFLAGGLEIITAESDHVIEIGGTTDFTIGGLFKVQGGDGREKVSFLGKSVNLKGGAALNLGDNVNRVDGNVLSLSAKSFSYRGGANIDQILLGADDQEIRIRGAFTADMGEGNNDIDFQPKVLLAIDGDMKVKSGSGQDNVVLESPQIELGQSIKLDLGDGQTDSRIRGKVVEIGGSAQFSNGKNSNYARFAVTGGLIDIGGNISATYGEGENFFNFGDGADRMEVRGSVTGVAKGDGLDAWNLDAKVLNVGGDISFTSGTKESSVRLGGGSGSLNGVKIAGTPGSDYVNFHLDGIVGGAVKIDLKGGENYFEVGGVLGDITLSKAIELRSSSAAGIADTVELERVNALAAFKIALGAGVSTVKLTDSVLAALSLNTGAGDDKVQFETASSGGRSVFKGAVAIELGAGQDAATFGNNTETGKSDFRSTLKVTDADKDADLVFAGALTVPGKFSTNIPA